MDAGCSLEDSCPPDEFAKFREKYPEHLCLTYINCSAAVKAMSDIIVTSSNAEHILNQLPKDQKIMMAPDRHLGAYLSKKTGREMIFWPGSCIVHERFSEKELIKLKAEHPDAPVTAHPECPEHILRHADHVGSTSSILKFVLDNPAEKFLVATEPGIIHQMQKSAPHKTFIGAPGADGNCNCNQCPYMALNTIEKLYKCLNTLEPQIEVDEITRIKALAPLNKMLEMSPSVASNRPPKSGRAF
jgi:quinolinate synthase